MRRVAVPALLVVLLLSLGVTRWHQQASSTRNGIVTKWTQDRWTGEVWIRTYSQRGFQEAPASAAASREWVMAPHLAALGDPRIRLRNILTWTYDGLVGGTALWLMATVGRVVRRPQAVNEEPASAPGALAK